MRFVRVGVLWDALRLSLCSTARMSRTPRVETEVRALAFRVSEVYDGDTVTICHVHNGCLRRRRARLYGFDAPEMRGVSAAEKKKAVAARDFLAQTLPSGVMIGRVIGLDKYGRLLLDIKVRGQPISRIMIREGHGVEYFGGTKLKKGKDQVTSQ